MGFNPLKSVQRTTKDLVNMMMGGGTDQPIIPRFGGNIGPTQKQVYSGMRQGVNELSGAHAINAFHNNPGLLTGAQMAVALPFPALRMASGGKVAKSGKLMSMMKRADDANAEQLASRYRHENLDAIVPYLNSLERYTGQKVKRGRTYFLDPSHVRPSKKYDPGDAFKDPRIAIIQDPQTGAMYTAGPDYHHGELMNAVERANYVRKHGVAPDPSFTLPGKSRDWFQHEIWAKQKFPNKDIPGRINFDAVSSLRRQDHPDLADTRQATVGRMRLLRDLKKHGYDSFKETEEGTSALTRLMRDKYNIGKGSSSYKGRH